MIEVDLNDANHAVMPDAFPTLDDFGRARAGFCKSILEQDARRGIEDSLMGMRVPFGLLQKFTYGNGLPGKGLEVSYM